MNRKVIALVVFFGLFLIGLAVWLFGIPRTERIAIKPTPVFLTTPKNPESCVVSLAEPPPIVTELTIEGGDQVLEQLTGVMETFLTSYTEACFSSDQKACAALEKYLREQLKEPLFLPKHAIWDGQDWQTYSADEYDRRLFFDMHGNKMLSLMVHAYWTLQQRGSVEIPGAKEWFLKRYHLFLPHYAVDETYEIPDAGGTLKVSRRAGNMYSASARFGAFLLITFDERSVIDKLKEQWVTSLMSTRPDGSFPVEARRGARSLFYANQLMSDLMMIYLAAKQAGIDLFAEFPETKHRLDQAAQFILRATADFKVAEVYAKVNHAANSDPDYKVPDLQSLQARMSWLLIYLQEFPDSAASQMAKTTSVDQRICSAPKRWKPFDCETGSAFLRDILLKDEGRIIGLKPSCFILRRPIEALFQVQ